ncbi:penicillin-binding protein 1C [Oceaniglobus indicus]|uniref:penicillin-binding protein 1C n=1 Tax=Oceaniglobus indicus TaxID=2047749 RepID=UPI000C1849C3|nr:penicillin-binding protein 1C [Oceaniglobus indicus]
MRAERVLFALAVALFCIGAARDGIDAWIDRTDLPSLAIETGTEVRDRHGDLLRAYVVGDGRWRLATGLDAVDPTYVSMLIAYEDKRFRRHAGADPWAILRAGADAVLHGGVRSGASTLTMQVARLLEDGPTGAWGGKLRQLRVALALERRLGKDAILTLYLNRAPFGGNIEGVRAAALTWFGKEPRRLTPAQAALLVALPQSPETRRPDRHPAMARSARDRVLDRLAGAGGLSPDAAIAAKREPIPTERRAFPALSPHLADRLTGDAPGAPVIATTLERPLQGALESLARQALRGRGDRLSIAIMVADHTTGDILAQVGSADYDNDPRQGFVDMTRALRSPGSTLKPLVYGLAFDRGLAHPETLIDDVPTAFGPYAPQNFDGQFRGTVRLREALQMSLNIPVVKLTEALGPARLTDALRRAGTDVVVPGGRPGLAVALGGAGVTLEGMVQLYATLANGGRRVDLRATPDTVAPGAAVISPEAAWHVGDILSGLAPPPGAPRNGLAYKTGTSYGHRDAWAIGWDGRHVAGVWMGRPDGTPVPGAFGGDLAAPVLFQTFARIAPTLTPLAPPPPATLMTGTADLPAPLRRFRGPAEIRSQAGSPPPVIAFPPDGARMRIDKGQLTIKLRDGRAPFTILADGVPVAVQSTERETRIDVAAPGYITLSVIDAAGKSARSQVRLDDTGGG